MPGRSRVHPIMGHRRCVHDDVVAEAGIARTDSCSVLHFHLSRRLDREDVAAGLVQMEDGDRAPILVDADGAEAASSIMEYGVVPCLSCHRDVTCTDDSACQGSEWVSSGFQLRPPRDGKKSRTKRADRMVSSKIFF